VLYLRHTPAPPLAAHIEELWCLADAPPHAAERVLPAGTLELVINLDEDEFRIHHPSGVRRYPGAMVSGAYRAPFVIDTREHASVIGVHFRPGGAAPFVGAPPGTLTDAHVELAALWSRRAGELRERLCEAPTAQARFALLEAALFESLAGARAGHAAIPHAMAALADGARVAAVAARLGLSTRRLGDVFTAEVGLAPKAFARIARFRRALDAAQRRAGAVDWAQLAAATGYTDQSHLIRDFRAFSGEAPTALLAHTGGRVKEHHVALAEPPTSDSSKTGPRAASTL
jgi:AraC-like DNA-binding protein